MAPTTTPLPPASAVQDLRAPEVSSSELESSNGAELQSVSGHSGEYSFFLEEDTDAAAEVKHKQHEGRDQIPTFAGLVVEKQEQDTPAYTQSVFAHERELLETQLHAEEQQPHLQEQEAHDSTNMTKIQEIHRDEDDDLLSKASDLLLTDFTGLTLDQRDLISAQYLKQVRAKCEQIDRKLQKTLATISKDYGEKRIKLREQTFKEKMEKLRELDSGYMAQMRKVDEEIAAEKETLWKKVNGYAAMIQRECDQILLEKEEEKKLLKQQEHEQLDAVAIISHENKITSAAPSPPRTHHPQPQAASLIGGGSKESPTSGPRSHKSHAHTTAKSKEERHLHTLQKLGIGPTSEHRSWVQHTEDFAAQRPKLDAERHRKKQVEEAAEKEKERQALELQKQLHAAAFRKSPAFALTLLQDQPDYKLPVSTSEQKEKQLLQQTSSAEVVPSSATGGVTTLAVTQGHHERAGLINQRVYMQSRGILVPPVGIDVQKAIAQEPLDAHGGVDFNKCDSPFYMPNVSAEQKEKWLKIVNENKHFLQDWKQELDLHEDLRAKLEQEKLVRAKEILRSSRNSSNEKNAAPQEPAPDLQLHAHPSDAAGEEDVDATRLIDANVDAGERTRSNFETFVSIGSGGSVDEEGQGFLDALSPEEQAMLDRELKSLHAGDTSEDEEATIQIGPVTMTTQEYTDTVRQELLGGALRGGGLSEFERYSTTTDQRGFSGTAGNSTSILERYSTASEALAGEDADLRNLALTPTTSAFKRELLQKAAKFLQRVKVRRQRNTYEQQDNVVYTRKFLEEVKVKELARREKERKELRAFVEEVLEGSTSEQGAAESVVDKKQVAKAESAKKMLERKASEIETEPTMLERYYEEECLQGEGKTGANEVVHLTPRGRGLKIDHVAIKRAVQRSNSPKAGATSTTQAHEQPTSPILDMIKAGGGAPKPNGAWNSSKQVPASLSSQQPSKATALSAHDPDQAPETPRLVVGAGQSKDISLLNNAEIVMSSGSGAGAKKLNVDVTNTLNQSRSVRQLPIVAPLFTARAITTGGNFSDPPPLSARGAFLPTFVVPGAAGMTLTSSVGEPRSQSVVAPLPPGGAQTQTRAGEILVQRSAGAGADSKSNYSTDLGSPRQLQSPRERRQIVPNLEASIGNSALGEGQKMWNPVGTQGFAQPRTQVPGWTLKVPAVSSASASRSGSLVRNASLSAVSISLPAGASAHRPPSPFRGSLSVTAPRVSTTIPVSTSSTQGGTSSSGARRGGPRGGESKTKESLLFAEPGIEQRHVVQASLAVNGGLNEIAGNYQRFMQDVRGKTTVPKDWFVAGSGSASGENNK
mmetsp:Transcript_5002/g.12573  ORF Transcript_5002/g.12573 Transcript_5002/m.12573 type:complete len:1326 (+) Transcript_5002:216-4193(+)|eukprot:CAMPEP_0178988964 /NCGR_PEP_ID=MMETSP0795-20121207/4091_1 /TAXON_ID=88552 /ORGANISM="Amoebophrya sp., Strain Ameob2" /LENGTH=1325 /DNA_ID=CAMNT_0020680273 /DNA_START=113 /DNA_END=4090 /DNA_ORIENTATION=-